MCFINDIYVGIISFDNALFKVTVHFVVGYDEHVFSTKCFCFFLVILCRVFLFRNYNKTFIAVIFDESCHYECFS